MHWTNKDIPEQTGRTAIVTGSNSGIGYETAKALAKRGATVILACRDAERGKSAVQRIADETSSTLVSHHPLDLASLQSISMFAKCICNELDRLDLLINNAGVMVPAKRIPTEDGFELQFGVNHLGHFALTKLLLDLLVSTKGSRVVTVSSQAHRHGRIHFDDLNWNNRYRRYGAYAQSKLCNLLFTKELGRRLQDSNGDTIAVAAHPGWTNTDLQRHIPAGGLFNRLFAMPPSQGALPILRAAVDPEVQNGEFIGPHGIYEMRGMPVRVSPSKRANNEDDAARLWEVSSELIQVAHA